MEENFDLQFDVAPLTEEEIAELAELEKDISLGEMPQSKKQKRFPEATCSTNSDELLKAAQNQNTHKLQGENVPPTDIAKKTSKVSTTTLHCLKIRNSVFLKFCTSTVKV